VRVPLMVAWPGAVKPGTTSDAVVAAVDLYPTILDALKVKQNPQQKMDGISIVPALKQSGPLNREAVFNYFPHGGAKAGVTVRFGDWKLIRWFDPERQGQAHELYNLRDDIGESNNMAAAHPNKVKELDALIDGFLKDTGALIPKPNPKYDPSAPRELTPRQAQRRAARRAGQPDKD
jgi:arylsulfatase A-like enzyme